VQALLVLLVITNLATAAALVMLWRFHGGTQAEDGDVLAALATQRSGTSGSRRVLTIEILNPVELAATRGRVVGIAGSLVPALTKRIVYDQTLKQMRKQLVDQGVVADVRLVKVTPAGAPAAVPAGAVAVPTARPAPTRGRQQPPLTEPLTDEAELLAVAASENSTAAQPVAAQPIGGPPQPSYVDPYPGTFDPFVADPFEEPQLFEQPSRQDPV